MTETMSPIYVELHRWMAMPFDWAQGNCIFVLADWVLQVTGIDPAADDRMTFDNMADCQRANGYFTDPLGVVEDRMSRAGFSRGNDLRAGDIAVLNLRDQKWPVGALWTGTSWAIKGPEGATTLRPEFASVLGFWSVGYAG